MSDLLTDPAPSETDTDDPRVAHIVMPASAVTEAYIEGTEVTALCGKRWVPTRDPTRLPVCRECKERAGWTDA